MSARHHIAELGASEVDRVDLSMASWDVGERVGFRPFYRQLLGEV